MSFDLYDLLNSLFFVFYIITNPKLIGISITRRVYLPVYIRFQWLKKFEVKTFLDIGSHKGHESKVINTLFPNAHIYAFEPNSSFNKIIKEKIPSKNLIVENIALSDKSGIHEIYFAENSLLTSIIPLERSGIRDGKKINTVTEKIETKTLDKYFKFKKLKKQIFLKIDAEGAEGLILKGAKNLLKEASIIYIEVYYKKLYKDQMLFDEVYQLLRSYGFVYQGDSREGYFYPKFNLEAVSNAIFINPKNLAD